MGDYVNLFLEEGEELTLSEDQAAPLVTEVSSSCSSLDLNVWII